MAHKKQKLIIHLRENGGGLWVQMMDKLRKGDDTRTPLQFTYEAADCRIFYTAESWADPVEAWK